MRAQFLLRVQPRVRYWRTGEGYHWANGPWAHDYYLTASGRVLMTVEFPNVNPLDSDDRS